jgi:glutamate dehydrogenase (NADP+)
MGEYANRFMSQLVAKNPGEPEFHQAVHEVAGSVELALQRNPRYVEAKIFERICEPERVLMFRVPWVDDGGEVQINRGFRVEMNSALGPTRRTAVPSDGLPRMLKFLAVEQVFKNSLTTLPLGAGKGGADFDPKGRSEGEVMRFCQSFMTELQRHVGQFTDVPAGDIGVGGREIGYLFGQYKRIRNEFTGVLTGKGLAFGGSLIRPEATGYGTVYFAEEMAATRGESLAGKDCIVSGSGNVAQYTVEKLIDLDAKPVTLSDSGGFVFDKDGIDREKLAWVMDLKNNRRGRIMEYVERYPAATFTPVDPSRSYNPLWAVPARPPSRARPERDQHRGRRQPAGGRRLHRGGGRQHADRERRVERFVGARILYGPGKAPRAASPSAGSRCHRTPSAAAGRARPSTGASTRSWSRSTRTVAPPPRNTTCPATTCTVRTSRGSARWPTRCSRRASSSQTDRRPGTSRCRKSRTVRICRTSSSMSSDPCPVV